MNPQTVGVSLPGHCGPFDTVWITLSHCGGGPGACRMLHRMQYRSDALRSALTPVVSQLGIDVGTLLGGVVAENVFGIGGIGQDSVRAIDQGNLPVIIGFVLIAAAFVVAANIVVDFCYALLDPRVRLT